MGNAREDENGSGDEYVRKDVSHVSHDWFWFLLCMDAIQDQAIIRER